MDNTKLIGNHNQVSRLAGDLEGFMNHFSDSLGAIPSFLLVQYLKELGCNEDYAREISDTLSRANFYLMQVEAMSKKKLELEVENE